MEILALVGLLIVSYLTTTRIASKTTVGQYNWFHTLCYKYQLLSKVQYWKGFYCEACHTFWLSLLILSVLGVPTTLTLLISFINYSIKAKNDENVKGQD